METLQDYLDAEGLTQAEFARKTNDSVQNISRYARGDRIPSKEKVIRIHELTDGRVTFASWYCAKPTNAKPRPKRAKRREEHMGSFLS